MEEFQSESEKETSEIAAQFAPRLRGGDVLCLHGTLGIGKSVFARALIRALARDPLLEVPSPTFTLVQLYDTKDATVFHFDLYRIEDPEEIFELGWEEACAEGIVIVEWPERLGPHLPVPRIDVHFSGTGERRRIVIENITCGHESGAEE